MPLYLKSKELERRFKAKKLEILVRYLSLKEHILFTKEYDVIIVQYL